MGSSTAESTWALALAKAKLSEVIRAAKKTPQVISTDGVPSAVLVDIEEYDNLMRLRRELILQRRRAAMSRLQRLEDDDAASIEFEFPERVDRPVPDFKEREE